MEYSMQEIASARKYGFLKQGFIFKCHFVEIHFFVTEAASLPTDPLVKDAAGKEHMPFHNHFCKVCFLPEITMCEAEIVRKLHTDTRFGIKRPNFTDKQTVVEGHGRLHKHLCQVGGNPVPVGEFGEIKVSPHDATIQIEVLSPSDVLHDVRSLNFTAF